MARPPEVLTTEVYANLGDKLLALFAITEESVENGNFGVRLVLLFVLYLCDINFDFDIADSTSKDGRVERLTSSITTVIRFAHAFHRFGVGVNRTLYGIKYGFRLSLVTRGEFARGVRIKGAGVVWIIHANVSCAAHKG